MIKKIAVAAISSGLTAWQASLLPRLAKTLGRTEGAHPEAAVNDHLQQAFYKVLIDGRLFTS